MQTKTLKNWSGSIAIVSMLIAFVLIHYVIVPHHIIIGPFWLWIFATLTIQLIPGLAFAIAGLRCKNRAGQVTAILALGLFLWFVWYAAVPVASTLWRSW